MEENYFGSLPKDTEYSSCRRQISRSSKSDLEGEETVEELDSPERYILGWGFVFEESGKIFKKIVLKYTEKSYFVIYIPYQKELKYSNKVLNWIRFSWILMKNAVLTFWTNFLINLPAMSTCYYVVFFCLDGGMSQRVSGQMDIWKYFLLFSWAACLSAVETFHGWWIPSQHTRLVQRLLRHSIDVTLQITNELEKIRIKFHSTRHLHFITTNTKHIMSQTPLDRCHLDAFVCLSGIIQSLGWPGV